MARYNNQTEEFLHFVWKQRLFLQSNLRSYCNKSIEVINPGELNKDAGPDFFNAKVKIDGILWVGNVEIHQNLEEWKLHGHHLDKAYDNVVLHVVSEGEGDTCRTNGEKIPVVKLKWPESLWNNYEELQMKNDWLACSGMLHSISSIDFSFWKERMLIERLEQRSCLVKTFLEATNSNWDEVFYFLLFRSFGFGVNSEPFERLARSVPLTVLLKYADSRMLIESVLFGQAGFLDEEFQDEYLRELKREYLFLKKKHNLKTLDKHDWKFLRLRPSNFPTIRISQLAGIICEIKGVFGKLINAQDIKDIKLYLNAEVSGYWESHYLAEHPSEKINKKLGDSSKNLIIINTIIPYLFLFGKFTNSNEVKDKAILWLELMKPERNSIIRRWEENEISINSAGDSQALIYLSNNYCKKNKCLHCSIGHKVLTIKKESEKNSSIS